MKKLLTIAAILLMTASVAQAQKTAFIRTDSILKVLPDYQRAQADLKAKADSYKADLEKDLKVIDDLYNSYQSQKQYLTSSARAAKEEQIISLEQALKDKQDKYFGAAGEIAKASEAVLGPIRERVNSIVRIYAQNNGYSMVVDLSAADHVIYHDANADITGIIIEKLK